MNKPNSIALRLLIALVCGSIITGFSMDAGWSGAGQSIITYPQHETQRELIAINKAIIAYRQQKHKLPRALSQLTEFQNVHIHRGENGDLLDGWRTPYRYTVQGARFLVVSYGRDGKPGGTGWDADLTSDNPHPPEADLTFLQFVTASETKETALWAIVTGVLTFFLCLITIPSVALTRQNIPMLLLALVPLLAAAAYVAAIITILHIPSGH